MIHLISETLYYTCVQIYKYTDIHTDRQTDRQTADIQADIPTDRQTDIQTFKYLKRCKKD
jgi:hypothetical protein